MKLENALPRIHVASPCHANWDQMKGDDRARFCQQCRKHVYNLSALSATAAARLIQEKEGKFCARFYRRADGTVLHAEDCPVGFAARQWRRVKHFASAVASLVLLLFSTNKSLAGEQKDGGKKSQDQTNPRTTMGEICLTPPPSPTPKPTPTPRPPTTP